jgi:hypothetical protein
MDRGRRAEAASTLMERFAAVLGIDGGATGSEGDSTAEASRELDAPAQPEALVHQTL